MLCGSSVEMVTDIKKSKYETIQLLVHFVSVISIILEKLKMTFTYCLILRTSFGFKAFKGLGDQVVVFLEYTNVGASFVFGESYLDHFFAFKVRYEWIVKGRIRTEGPFLPVQLV